MKVTKELVEQYLCGNCTDEERRAVDQWLESAENEETVLSDDTLEDMHTGIWASLETVLPEPCNSVSAGWWHGLSRVAAAACLATGLLGLAFLLVYKNATTEIAFSSYGMQEELRGGSQLLGFSLQPNSSVTGSISQFKSQGYLNFTGSLKLFSEAGSNLEIDFGVGDKVPLLSRRAIIEDRQVYYIGVLKQADSPDEILVLNSEQLEDIPPRIKIMAFNDYDI